MNIKQVVLLSFFICFFSACGVNNIVWSANSNIKKVQIGMTKEEVISILGDRYMITASSKDSLGNPVEVLGYKSDVDEEYKLHFLNNTLTEWNREHVQKYLTKDSPL